MGRGLTRTRLIGTALATAIGVIGGLVATAAQTKSGAAGATSSAAKRGEYLVTAVGCGDCHTPQKMGANGPEADMSKLLSGHQAADNVSTAPALPAPWMAAVTPTFTAWTGPWGISYSANLTPDKETGIGSWTEQQFVDTIRGGRHQGRGRPLLPPMPWPAFKNFSDADLRAIFAYLRTVAPINNRVPDPVAPAGSK